MLEMWMNSFLHNCLFGRSLLTLRLDSFTWDFKDYTAESWTHLLPLFLGDSPQTSPVCNPWSPSNDLHPNSVVLWLFVSFSGLWTQDLNEYTQTWAASPCGLFSMAGNVAVLYVIWHLLPHLLVIQPLFICGEPIPCGLGEYMTRPGLLSPTAS